VVGLRAGNLSADLGLAAAEFLAAAREEFWLEAARLARRLTPAIGRAAGYAEDDLARDLGIDPRDRAVSADAFTGSFWQETERAARDHSG
jgi:hypothetical protein